MTEPENILIPMLREMRSENAAMHADTRARLERIEERLRSHDHTLTADTLMSKLITGEFEERIEARERKVRELEGQK